MTEYEMREKLVELLQDGENPVWGWFPNNATMLQLADYLIANGVTFAKDTDVPTKWISVKDRLPEEWHRVLVFVPSIDAIIPAKLRGGSWYSTWDTTRLEYVSHWMPIPEKPQPHTPDTNAERIRAMSDEELADWIARTQIANVAEALEVAKIPWEQSHGLKDEVKEEVLDWLRQPAEEETWASQE